MTTSVAGATTTEEAVAKPYEAVTRTMRLEATPSRRKAPSAPVVQTKSPSEELITTVAPATGFGLGSPAYSGCTTVPETSPIAPTRRRAVLSRVAPEPRTIVWVSVIGVPAGTEESTDNSSDSAAVLAAQAGIEP